MSTKYLMMDYLLLRGACFQFDFCFLEVLLVIILEKKNSIFSNSGQTQESTFHPISQMAPPTILTQRKVLTQGLCR